MTTKIDILKTYLNVIELAKVNDCRIVRDDYVQMSDDLEYDIFNEYINEVI